MVYLTIKEVKKQLHIHVKFDSFDELPVQLGIVCWLRQAPKGSLFRNACGIQFRYADELEREAMKEYMEHVRAKYKI